MLPDVRQDEACKPLEGRLIASSGQPLRPSPSMLHPSHVAAHAVRHLADLAVRDPVVGVVAEDDRPLWAAGRRAAARARADCSPVAS